jgi:hypothetical protein
MINCSLGPPAAFTQSIFLPEGIDFAAASEIDIKFVKKPHIFDLNLIYKTAAYQKYQYTAYTAGLLYIFTGF